MSITDQYGTIDKNAARDAGYSIEDGGAWITGDVDVLIPAALEGQITAETVQLIHPSSQTDCRRCQWPHHSRGG